MFAPEGYVFFEEIVARIRKLSSEAYPHFGSRPTFETMKLRNAGEREAMIEFAATCPSLSVASPQTVVMRVSPRILNFYEHLVYNGTYLFIEGSLGLVDTLKALSIVRRAEEEMLVCRAKVEASQERNYELRDFIADAELALEDGDCIKAFEPFNGWSVVCRREHLPNKPSDLEAFSDVEISATAEPSSKDIVALLIRLVDIGQRPDKDEFRRRECPGIKRDEFRAIWAEAAKKRPVLSRRGPKPMINIKI